MIQYILECIAFQLVFLVIYDFLLKKETFFQWNRAYLIVTHVLSLVLPWIKLEALRTETPVFQEYSEMLWNMQPMETLVVQEAESGFTMPWYLVVFLLGVLVASIWFGIKLWRLHQLRSRGRISYFKDFTQILVPKSHIAFSFFKSIFLGDHLNGNAYKSIVSHELVHIKQWHSLDLLFFELLRIVTWFNPLVYIYQHKLTELHEFIADAEVPKGDRQAHCEMLLSQAFEVQHISFVNPFYKSSLIKKRIVMLQKSKSKKIWQLKYVLLVPMVLGMLCYTSCKNEKTSLEERLVRLNQEIEEKDTLTANERNEIAKMVNSMVDDYNRTSPTVDGWKVNVGVQNKNLESVPFANVDEIPIYPGCENVEDKRACFNEKIQQHISKNFRYPEEAQEKGIQGRVSSIFTISENGHIQNIKLRGPSPLLEDEVERIFESLPVMIPGKNDGINVPVAYSIPVNFKLQGDEQESGKASAIDFLQVNGGLTVSNGKSIFKGKVMDSESMGIPGVNILVEGTNTAAISNFDGEFAIEVSEGETLKFQYEKLPIKRIKVVRRTFGIRNETLPDKNSRDELVKEIGENTIKYNALVTERNRLLKSASEDNPIIVNLDDQLTSLRSKIEEQLNKDVDQL